MALTSTLFTGLSGLNVNQQRLNVVGNNIANANTTAFKGSRAIFSPQFYVTDSGGGPADATFGGQNPSQRGLGAQVAAIQKDFTQGGLETTGKSTDLAIDGKGFFVLDGKDRHYTRDGSFTLNSNSELVSSQGDYVMGYGADDTGKVIAGALQKLKVPIDIKSQAQATKNVVLNGNLKADGDLASGASVLASGQLASLSAGTLDTATPLTDLTTTDGTTPSTTPLFASGDTLTIKGSKGGGDLKPLTFKVDATSTVQDLLNFYNQGLQIDTSAATTASAPTGFTPGATFDGTTGKITITGNTGELNALALTGNALSSTNPNMSMSFADDTTSNPVGESINTNFQVFDSLGTPVNVNVTAVLQSKDNSGSTWRFFASSPDNASAGTFTPGTTPTNGALLGTGTLKFDNSGHLTASDGTTLPLDRSNSGATPNQSIKLDFSTMTSLTTRTSSLRMDKQDGFATGSLNGFNIGTNGTITGTFTNGQSKTLGQVALATFDNEEGLTDDGSNLFSAGSNSGNPSIAAPLSSGAGALRTGELELSNVDLSREFTNLIISSTGFSAASRVITTSNQLLTELLNTAR